MNRPLFLQRPLTVSALRVSNELSLGSLLPYSGNGGIGSGWKRQEHLSDGALEQYSLDKLAEPSLVPVEEHMLVCDQCRARLEAIEPVSFVHYTADGRFHSRVTRLATGKLMARHWDKDLNGGRTLQSVSAAKQYLNKSFSQMFPEHTCDRRCSQPQEFPKARAAGRD
jgi:hypothetical protein